MSNTEPSLSLPAAIKSGMRKDIDMQHPLVTACMRPKKNNIAQCDVCHIFFKQKKYLRDHQIKEHGHKPEWQCSVCDLVLCSKYNLTCHMDKHKDTKKHKCPACPASFNTRASKRRHYMYKHTEERPHQCSLCNFATVEHDKLLIHLRNHTGESPYKCDTCGMTFKTPISYKRHVVTHTGWRQYLCHLCLKKFGTPASVKEHIFRTHGVTKNNLDKVRNVKEHGLPSLLAKFLEGKKLDDSETKMLNCLKYYEILESADDDLEITNMDLNILETEVDGKIVDKSPFFMLKSKDAVQFLPTNMNKAEYEDPSNWIEVKPVMEKQTITRKRRSVRKKIKTEYDDNSESIEMNSKVEFALSNEGQDLCSPSQGTEEEPDIKSSNAVKATDAELPTNGALIQTRRKGLKRKRETKSKGKIKSEIQNEQINENCSNDCEESSQKAVEQHASVIQEQDESEINKIRIEDKNEFGHKSMIGTDEQESEKRQSVLDPPSSFKLGEVAASESSHGLPNEKGDCTVESSQALPFEGGDSTAESSQVLPVEGGDSTTESSQTLPIEGGGSTAETGDQEVVASCSKDIEKKDEIVYERFASKSVENRQQDRYYSESDEDETETSEGSIFLHQARKSLSLKTPKLNCPVNDRESFKASNKPISRVSSVVPTISASPVSNFQAVRAVSNETVKVADSSYIQGRDDKIITEEEIQVPQPTSFVSVISDNSKDGTVTCEDVTSFDEEESEASDESFDSNVLKGGPPKSLPPFISLERCSDEHKERLLTGMKKGVFGPTPSVIRVLEDGSMINVSNLYKAYLPPST